MARLRVKEKMLLFYAYEYLEHIAAATSGHRAWKQKKKKKKYLQTPKHITATNSLCIICPHYIIKEPQSLL